MPDLPQKKVGIIACSGEELPEGTVTRLAALKVLEELRPADTVTICLPLFLAGGEGDRAFARFYPTIAVDGCALRCAARGTEKYSGKPAASLVVSEDGRIIAERTVPYPRRRSLDLTFKEFELLACLSCGKRFLPKEQLEYVQKKFRLPPKIAQTCATCGGPRV